MSWSVRVDEWQERSGNCEKKARHADGREGMLRMPFFDRSDSDDSDFHLLLLSVPDEEKNDELVDV